MSRARTSALPARAQGSTGRARVFGQSTPVSLASFDPGTSSWRTSQLSLLGGSELFSETWPRSGMTRSGTAFQLAPLAPLTAATGPGLSPTWGTPTARDWKDTGDMTNVPVNGLLGRQVLQWPTPTAWLGRRPSQSTGNAERFLDPARSNELSDAVAASGTSGSLNPTWVEWLMGFPLGWTVCEAWETRLSRRSRNGSGGK